MIVDYMKIRTNVEITSVELITVYNREAGEVIVFSIKMANIL